MSRAGETIRLESRADGFVFDAYHVKPGDARRGGLVLIQEIFGVTDHIRELADGFAEDGYEVIAPAFYDRLEPGFEADYSPESIQKGVRHATATPWDQVAGDAQAA
ncbi:MAG: dienelactone hydrolase family protein, partial [Phenylobacterium sp.]|nr:dienelactone hydrolase family protein [Phenylobacterium sp.]